MGDIRGTAGVGLPNVGLSTNTPEPPATVPPAVAEQPLGALNLGVDVGAIVNANVDDEYVPAPDSTSKSSSSVNANSASAQDVSQASDTFATLASDQSPDVDDRRLTDQAVDLQQELDPSLKSLEDMAALEAKLGGGHAGAFNKMRKGAMLVTSDGQETRAKKTPVDQKAFAQLQNAMAKKQVIAKEDAQAAVAQWAQSISSSQVNVAALVEQVLRESYMLGTLEMIDYAEKVQGYNKRAKAIRDQLQLTSQTETAWSAKQDPTANAPAYVSDHPFTLTEFGENGKPIVPKMSQSDADYVTQVMQAQQAANPQSPDSISQFKQATGPSTLTYDQIDTLQTIGGQDVHYIHDHMGDLLSILPSMTFSDMDKYLNPIMNTLATNTSVGLPDPFDQEMMQIYGALSPVQLLYSCSGIPHSDLISTLDAFGPGTSIVSGKTPSLGDVVGVSSVAAALSWAGIISSGPLNDGEMADLNKSLRNAGRTVLKDIGSNESVPNSDVSAGEAQYFLAQLNAKATAPPPPPSVADTPPTVGDDRRAYTVKQIQDYKSDLENQLNSNGDDSQLANLDLQNALNRQQATLSMMSNISKVLHDTAMAIIRKSGE